MDYCHPFRNRRTVGSLIAEFRRLPLPGHPTEAAGTQTRMHHARQRQELYSGFIVEATKR